VLLITVEERGQRNESGAAGLQVEKHLMIVADIYRRYAAECVNMSWRRENVRDKALLLQMAAMWLHLAEFAEKDKDTDESPPTV
jgi:hypothetical protein